MQKLYLVYTILHNSISKRDNQIYFTRNYHNYKAVYNILVDIENAILGKKTITKSQLIKKGIKLSFNIF